MDGEKELLAYAEVNVSGGLIYLSFLIRVSEHRICHHETVMPSSDKREYGR